MKIKLPPRFKIYHNISEDYYFIKERYLFLFYRLLGNQDGWLGFALLKFNYISHAEKHIQDILTLEKESPDKIELVKTID